MKNGYIYGINGPVVAVKGTDELKMMEMVKVGKDKLIGEVIGLESDRAIVQVYEETTSVAAGEEVVGLKNPMSALLGPGLIGSIFDGIQRPLLVMEQQSGAFIERGMDVSSLDTEKKWDVRISAKVGDKLKAGDIVAETDETESIVHKIMVPPGLNGEVTFAEKDGSYTINDVIIKIKDETGAEHDVTLCQKWPIRKARPYAERKTPTEPLITGQRVIDALFPIAKGGAAAIPGGFGTGKTMTQHQLAKWCDADIIVYIGCGERGNEMTQVLEDFTALIDPRTGKSLMNRTILIANTSNMPVAAREACIYTGVTLAEYYRDMGYNVAIMADSTSRWAEALREISGRLEEMPAEEGFPAYLPSRLSTFYERAGMVDNLNGTKGSISIIGAVSPQGGDFSEPVTQNTKRFIRCFWALDRSLAYQRHYPAINWLTSYSEYSDDLKDWFDQNVSEDFDSVVLQIKKILTEESSLMEIVKLIGSDVLPDSQRLVLEVAKIVRLGFLQQNAFNPTDTYVPLKKQYLMLKTCLTYYEEAKKLIAMGVPVSQIHQTGLTEKLVSVKYDVKNDDFAAFDRYADEIKTEFDKIGARYAPKKAVQ
ncbi:V-type ATP synthase subunit A [Qingrenia yutianensis]|uniref:V-type ATP synthase alpha chain n=1 Tax=Qingrenia yutianensis TaxID=2763676 RepID=A0A926F9Y5_9FIRM|nr:V-type ATP synthase subunit A [Qingrenia yutianensis]MBC8596660.1 V-type ATP synthase subunit A [Qingrenia yutianensis]